jgi:hypothetical protein
MDVILDTNIIRNDFGLRASSIDLLLDYIDKTNSHILLPKVVFEEISQIYRNELNIRYNDYTTKLRQLKNLNVFTDINELMDLTPKEVDKYLNNYIAFIKKRFNPIEIDYKNEYLPEMVDRAIKRKKPFDSKGQQFRDCILWLSILDYAATGTPENMVAFISNNVTDFADSNSKLHEELDNEAIKKGVKINYYKSITEFIRNQASQIDFFTRDWLEKNLNFKKLNTLISKKMVNVSEHSVLRRIHFNDDEEPTDNVDFNGIVNSEITNFFIYEKKDGALIGNVSIYYECEFQVEYRKKKFEPHFRENMRIDRSNGKPIPNYDYDYLRDYEFGYKSPSLELEAQFEFTIENRTIENYEFLDYEYL